MKINGLNKSLVPLLGGLLLSACAGGPVDELPAAGAPLQGPVVEQRWRLLLVGTDERLSMPETPWFTVDREGRLSGSDGCAPLEGRVSLGEGQRIEVEASGRPPRACAQAEEAQRVRDLLETAYRYLIDHDRLIFFGPDQRVLGGFRKAS